MKIAIKGFIGSGKTTISNKFSSKYNYKEINADKLVAKIYDEELLKDELILTFGVYKKTDIKEIVFSNKDKLKELENIIHPKLQIMIEDEITDDCIIDAQIIDKLNIKYDYEILCFCSKEEIIKRVLKRDDRTDAEIIKILKIQEEFRIQKKKQYVLNTEGEDIDDDLDKIKEMMENDKNWENS